MTPKQAAEEIAMELYPYKDSEPDYATNGKHELIKEKLMPFLTTLVKETDKKARVEAFNKSINIICDFTNGPTTKEMVKTTAAIQHQISLLQRKGRE